VTSGDGQLASGGRDPTIGGGHHRPTHGRPGGIRQFDDRPLLVFWETTKACDLACVHCRASAQGDPGPDEVTTDEGRALIDELAAIGRPRPILILTGGDCMKRPDITELVAYAGRRSVPVALSPSVTPQLTDRALDALHSHGVKTASLSLDGATSGTHDGIRGIAGHFDSTLEAIARLQSHGLTVQINTTVMARNLTELADIAVLMHEMGVDTWEVFFLITTGRGTEITGSTPQENEDVCNFLVDASRYGFTVRTVEAPFFRRVVAERRSEGHDGSGPTPTGDLYDHLRDRLVDRLGAPTAPVRAPSAATRDGKGIIFIAANGDVYPSGFMPLRLGNVRNQSLVEIYRDHPVLRKIRDATFVGACGACEHAQLCGGSRARSFASSGDPLGSDPGCILVADRAVAASM
jgi:AdoMet-dependent heme synthase